MERRSTPMSHFDPNILAALISGGGCMSFLQYLINRYDVKKGNKIDPEQFTELLNMSCGSIQDRIWCLSEKYIARGYITCKEKALILGMYEPYCALGKNNYAHTAWEAIDKLPIQDDPIIHM